MHPLDNPTWSALTSYQEKLALVNGPARRFPAGMCLHGAFAGFSPAAWEAMAHLAREPVGLLTLQPPEVPPGWSTLRAVELFEMVQEGGAPRHPLQNRILDLTSADLPRMIALYEATRPGRHLAPRLYELGGFIGIRDGDRLAAMACLRLHFPGFREISTVGTLPGHTGRGYATALVSELCGRIRAAGERAFLTVRSDNHRAREIYLRLGFRDRTRLYSTTVRWEGA